MYFTRIALTCCCLLMSASLVLAHGSKHEKRMDMQVMMETYQKLAMPGQPHKQLANLVGMWTTKIKWWAEPGKPPMESMGACEQRMLLGGRFLQQECTGEMMGQAFSGIGMMGYDNHTKTYVSTWMDSMGTGIYFMEGTASSDGKAITQTGRYNDPIEGPMKLRSVTTMLDGHTEVFEMYGTGEHGKEMKMLEILYTRAK